MFRSTTLIICSALLVASASFAEDAPAPEVATPEVATPEVATPEVATPEVATPEVATPEVTAPKTDRVANAARSDEPNIEERRIVAYVATGASLTALAVGITMGVLAQQQFACLEDVIACNKTLDDPIEGTELLDAQAEVEHKALIADMMYLVAGAAAIVATTGFLRGFIMTGEEADADVAMLPSVSNIAFAGASHE